MSETDMQRVMLSCTIRGVLAEHRGDEKVEGSIAKAFRSAWAYVNQMPRGEARISHLHKNIDEAVEKDLEDQTDRPPVSCKKGCAHCCHLFVMCTHEEADLIYKVAKKRNIPLSRKRLEYQARFKNPGDYFTRFGKRTKCVFLNDKNECMIYEHRPISCRKYLALSPPEKCLPDESGGTQSVTSPVCLSVEALASAHMNVDIVDGLAKEDDNFSMAARLLERMKKDG